MIATTEVGLTQGGRAKAAAYRKADEWCRKRGLVMVPIAVDQHSAEPFGRYGGAELTFRALKLATRKSGETTWRNQITHNGFRFGEIP